MYSCLSSDAGHDVLFFFWFVSCFPLFLSFFSRTSVFYSFSHSFARLFVCSFVHSYVCLFVRSFLRRSFVRLFGCSFLSFNFLRLFLLFRFYPFFISFISFLNLHRLIEGDSLTICHLAELDGDTLYLYGPGSLDALDRNWGAQAVNSVQNISIKFINYDTIVPHLAKISSRFPSLVVSR